MKKINELFRAHYALISYLVFGGLTTLINIITFVIFQSYLGVNYQFANVIAWFVSVVFAFVTNKLWVFGSKNVNFSGFMREILSFFVFRILSLVIDQLIMTIGVSVLHLDAALVKLFDQVFIVLINYVFSKLFIFKKS
ncbi:GtrA family protein [Dellaglioa algida]|uniref:Membrane protein n=1 Tax=Dellaglioa algida TaxID=105612 RepID=A0A5C6M8Q8_9LACO|nr:GtrA family protein [Dellaglioa algida]MDK1717122.1 GtrA family protein [Dellaglioa algida]MDK1719808.1 GtrA family protein [Dellaglioa algida]MDK1722064.1 GtrA family protein [Dellaglioa algida]MDK1723151.1 GtrA family protein [Dellaglioa algida]MDK1739897.1 GtrA family protein [Dellaglioa algida]